MNIDIVGRAKKFVFVSDLKDGELFRNCGSIYIVIAGSFNDIRECIRLSDGEIIGFSANEFVEHITNYTFTINQ